MGRFGVLECDDFVAEEVVAGWKCRGDGDGERGTVVHLGLVPVVGTTDESESGDFEPFGGCGGSKVFAVAVAFGHVSLNRT